MDDAAHLARENERLRHENDQLRRECERQKHDPRAIRQTQLRRVRRVYYPFAPRTTAARMMAEDWRAYDQERASRPPREGAELVYEELIIRGCKPLCMSTIERLLDDDR